MSHWWKSIELLLLAIWFQTNYKIISFETSLEKIAEAHRNRVILEAEAESEAIRIKGDAEAFSLEAKGKAEAEKLARKAEAYKLYKDAAVTEMLLQALPKVFCCFKL